MRIAVRRALFAVLVAAIAAVIATTAIIKANGSVDYGTYGSGPAAAPVSSPIRSTPDYISRSAWMIVGDSITVRDYKAVAATNPGARLAVNAWSGRNTTLSVNEVLDKRLTPTIPKYLIMAVGSNDVMSPFVMPTQIKRLLDYVNTNFPDTQVFWVDVQVNRPAYSPSDQRNTMLVNKAIWQGCTQQYDCTVISWATFLAAKPSRIAMYIDSGGVHPNPNGVLALAQVIDQAVPVS